MSSQDKELQHKQQECVKQILALFENNPILFGKYFFDNHFRSKSPKFHIKILKEAFLNTFLAVAAPRGSAKSTILSFLYPIHQICFKKRQFIVIVSNTFSKSSQFLETIKEEVKTNQKLNRFFGIKITKDAVGDSIFLHPDGSRVRVLCKGAEQIPSVRGEKFGSRRPDLIIIDDLEDDELVKNPDRRRELKEDYDNALVPAGDIVQGQYITKIIIIGTILHDDSLMAKFVSPEFYKEYRKLKFKARFEVGGERYSLWPEKWTLEFLDEWERTQPESFAQEAQNDPVSGIFTQFKREDFRYWNFETNCAVLYDEFNHPIAKHELKKCNAAIACDLAWEEKRTSDFSVIVPAFLTPNNEILIDYYICKKGLRPDEIEEIVFTMENRLLNLTGSVVQIGFEKAKLEKVIKHLLQKAMLRRNHYLLFKDLEWDADKIQRISTRLQPRYAQHVMFHRRGMGELEQQLLRFPSGVHDDLPDAVQGIVQLLKYPKKEKAQQVEDTEFEWYRKLVLEKHNRQPMVKQKFKFGIPALQSYR